MVVLLVNQGQRAEAVRTLQQMEPNLLDWVGQELYSTEGGVVRWPLWRRYPQNGKRFAPEM